MANHSLNQNQTFQTPILGQVTQAPNGSVFSCQIYPSTSATVITAGQAVKLVGTTGANVVVDVTTSASDGPIFGVIANIMRKNTYSPGDYVTVVGNEGVLMLKSSAAIARGAALAVTNQSVSTNDPTVATASTVGFYIAGSAITPAIGANQLIEVKVRTGVISSTGVISLTA